MSETKNQMPRHYIGLSTRVRFTKVNRPNGIVIALEAGHIGGVSATVRMDDGAITYAYVTDIEGIDS